MSFADEDEFAAFAGRDALLPEVTATAVGDCLIASPHKSDLKVTLGWLATAVRRSLAVTIPNVTDGPGRKANAEIRKELDNLADLVHSAWAVVFDRSHEVDSRLWDHAFRNWEGANALATSADASFAYNQFQEAVARLDWLACYLREAARETEQQKGRWRQSEERRLRVMRGQVLAPVFELAFGLPVTANNWPSGKERGKTAFMDFYQRMVALAFGEHSTPDISGVLKLACKLHHQEPVELTVGIIPEVEWGATPNGTNGDYPHQ